MQDVLARLGRSLSRRRPDPAAGPSSPATLPTSPTALEAREALEHRARTSKTFCAAPWVHFLTTPDGGVLPCCMGKKAILGEDGEGANVRRTDPAAIWNGSDFRRIRQALLDGETLPHCVTCLDYEAMGHTSYRKKFNLDYFGEEGGALRTSFLDPGARSGRSPDGRQADILRHPPGQYLQSEMPDVRAQPQLPDREGQGRHRLGRCETHRHRRQCR